MIHGPFGVVYYAYMDVGCCIHYSAEGGRYKRPSKQDIAEVGGISCSSRYCRDPGYEETAGRCSKILS